MITLTALIARGHHEELALAGLDAPRSRGHYVYVGLEAIKALALAAGGILLLSS